MKISRAAQQRIPQLSANEREQLGQPSNSRWHPDPEEWVEVRDYLLEKSQKRDPSLTPDMTAYTPGETLELLQHPTVAGWHENIKTFTIPADVDTVVFVPCAATKPWDTATRGIYKSYNQLRDEMREGKIPSAYFVTISEPLGVVPEDMWGDFPTYDNPGLFKNDSARAGRTTTKQWLERFGKNFVTPFDDEAYDQCIDTLSGVIAEFVKHNDRPGRQWLSFVDDRSGKSTHTDMLERADQQHDFLTPETMFPKRAKPRQAPYPLIRETLLEHSE